MSNIKLILIGLAVVILIGTIVWNWTPAVAIPKNSKVMKIKHALILPRVTLSSEAISLIDSNYHNVKNFADYAFPGWDHNTKPFKDLTLFTIKLLEFWATYGRKKSKNYPEIVESIITQVVAKLQPMDLSKLPWGDSWYVFAAYVTRMFAMYEYVGDNPNLQRDCHNLLIKITPNVSTTHLPNDSTDYNTMNMYFTAIPRLCSNFMFDPKNYELDIQNSDFTRVQTFLNFEPIKDSEPKTGVYQDHSWIHYGDVATYELLFGLYNFHERVYTALDLPNSIHKLAEEIIPKLLHPQIPYRPFGLSGRNGIIYDTTTYWDIVPNGFGVHIFPYIGFGIFKTPDYLFYIRVQRPKIATYLTNSFENEKIFALAWVQMPKCYIRTFKSYKGYDAKVTGASLMNHPGLLLINNVDYSSDALSNYNENLRSHYVDQNSIDSYVGIAKDAKDLDMLFWKNEYKFTEVYGDCTVTEVGLAMDSGVEYLLIVENYSDHDLIFRFKDDNYHLSTHLSEETKSDVGGSTIKIPKSTTKDIRWGIEIHGTSFGTIKCTKNKVTFENSEVKFHVETITPNERFIVIDEKGKTVAAGSSSSDPEDSFKERNINFVRNKRTLMYEPVETV